MMDYNDNIQNGIFVINGQIFSVNDLLDIMKKHGIKIKMNQNGMFIDGEQISSISNFNDNKCPLATTCEKRVALVEFLKLQRSQESRSHQESDFHQDIFPQSYYKDTIDEPKKRSDFYDYRKEDSRRDFIKPNNHDLFEGNISGSSGLFDEPITVTRGLFDEPDLFTEPESTRFEDSFYREKDFEERRRENYNESYSNNNRKNSFEGEQPFCSECGFDLRPSWVSCPNCGHRIVKSNYSKEGNSLF